MYQIGDTVVVRCDIDAPNRRMLHDLAEHNYICVIDEIFDSRSTDYPICLDNCYVFLMKKTL